MLILASQSTARKAMLTNAGVNFTAQITPLDEAHIKHDNAHLEPIQLALTLAKGKAMSLAKTNPHAFVIGSDQTLECQQEQYSKPTSRAEAAMHLKKLRGKTHHLHSAVALAKAGEVIWSMAETATLHMRNFSDSFLETYLAAESSNILHCVGCYRIEGMGLQLFDKIDGNHQVILGMPLLPLLHKLREHGLIAT